MRILSTRIADAVACSVVAAAMALLQGCAASAPQYVEASPALAPAATTEVARQQNAGAEGGAVPGVQRAEAAGTDKGDSGVTGVWQGQLWANCNVIMMVDATRCGAVNAITLTLLQKDKQVSGFYRCAFGNMDCLNLNETGKIAAGSMGAKLLSMRVMMPDGSDCLYNGRPLGDAMQGSYSCMQGGGLIEQGLWKVRRSY